MVAKRIIGPAHAGSPPHERSGVQAGDWDLGVGEPEAGVLRLTDAAPKEPRTPDELHAWLRDELGVRLPRSPLVREHAAPFDYLVHAFFEGRFTKLRGKRGVDRTNGVDLAAPGGSDDGAAPDRPDIDRFAESGEGAGPTAAASAIGDHALADPAPTDCVVWANRGGGKTFLGAIATLLDLLYKPGIEIRVLGGSLDQSRRMHAHLRRLLDPLRRPTLHEQVAGKITDRRIALRNGSEVELLAASQTSVRGTRVQKLRCDEVDLFDTDLWEAAQLVTRSKTVTARDGRAVHVRGTVECLSTMHLPYGIMHRVVGEARQGSRRLFRWGVVDVLDECGPERACRGTEPIDGGESHGTPDAEAEGAARVGDCPLWRECKGRAKSRPAASLGHVTVDDAITQKRRVSLATWEAEMLCLRPRRNDSVLPEFDHKVHVRSWPGGGPEELAAREPDGAATASPERLLAWVGGMDFGFRAPTVVLWACVDSAGALWIVDEHVVRETILSDVIAVMRRGLGERGTPGAPGCGWPALAWIGVDPAGKQKESQTGRNNHQCLRDAGFRVRFQGSGIADGLALIRARLQPADGPPRLFIDPRCARLIESMETYHYDPRHPDLETPAKDGPDHAVDALRYLVLNLDRAHKAAKSDYAAS